MAMITDTQHDGYISIGQFAKAAQLSLKALRLYHQKGLLTPAYVDPFTGYRYYTADQVQTAHLIRLLRETEMPLSMVKQFIEKVATKPTEAEAILHRYLRLFDARVNRVHQTAHQVMSLIQDEESLMTSEREICLDDLPAVADDRLLEVLALILDEAASVLPPESYRLVGTTAALMHGVQLPARGVDFLMRERDTVDAFHLAMAPFRCDVPPTHLPADKQYWASYFVDEVNVGVSTVEWEATSDGIECFGSGPWEHFSMLRCGSHTVPTVNLELRLVTELCRDRADRYEPLLAHMSAVGCDVDLVQRGMAERQIPPARQSQVIQQLTGEGRE